MNYQVLWNNKEVAIARALVNDFPESFLADETNWKPPP